MSYWYGRSLGVFVNDTKPTLFINYTNTTNTSFYPCLGHFHPNTDIISKLLHNSTVFLHHSPPLSRLLQIIPHQTYFTQVLLFYSTFTFVALICSITLRILIVRSGLQSSVAFILERGNRCGTNLAARRRNTFACLIVLTRICQQLPILVLFIAGLHLAILADRIWVGLLTITFGVGVTLVLFATTTSLASCGHCGPRQRRTVTQHLGKNLYIYKYYRI